MVNGKTEEKALIQWAVMNPDIVQLEGYGQQVVIFAKKEGIARINVQHKASMNTLDVVIIVERDKTSEQLYITSNKNLFEMKPGMSERINVTLVGGQPQDVFGFNWEKISDYNLLTPNKAVINITPSTDSCYVTAVDEGEAVLRVSHPLTKYSLDIKIEIRAVFNVSFGSKILVMNQQETRNVSVTAPEGQMVRFYASKFRASSASEEIDVVNVYGTSKVCIVEAVNPGYTVITVSNLQGTATDEMIVEVKAVNNPIIQYIDASGAKLNGSLLRMMSTQNANNYADLSAVLKGTIDDGSGNQRNVLASDNANLRWRIVPTGNSGGGAFRDFSPLKFDGRGDEDWIEGGSVRLNPTGRIGTAEIQITHSGMIAERNYKKYIYVEVVQQPDNFHIYIEESGVRQNSLYMNKTANNKGNDLFIGLEITGLDEEPSAENGYEPYWRYKQLLDQNLIQWEVSTSCWKETQNNGRIPKLSVLPNSGITRRDNRVPAGARPSQQVQLDGKFAKLAWGQSALLTEEDFVDSFVVSCTYGGITQQATIIVSQSSSLEITMNSVLTVYPKNSGIISVKVTPRGSAVTHQSDTAQYLEHHSNNQDGSIDYCGSWSCATARRYLPPGVFFIPYSDNGPDPNLNNYTNVGDGTPRGCYEDEHILTVTGKDTMIGGYTRITFKSGAGHQQIASVYLSTDFNFSPVESSVIRGKPGDTGRFYFNVTPEDDVVKILSELGTAGTFGAHFNFENGNNLSDVAVSGGQNLRSYPFIIGKKGAKYQPIEVTLQKDPANGKRYFDWQLNHDGYAQLLVWSETNDKRTPKVNMSIEVFSYYDKVGFTLEKVAHEFKSGYGQGSGSQLRSRVDENNGIIYIADGENFELNFIKNGTIAQDGFDPASAYYYAGGSLESSNNANGSKSHIQILSRTSNKTYLDLSEKCIRITSNSDEKIVKTVDGNEYIKEVKYVTLLKISYRIYGGVLRDDTQATGFSLRALGNEITKNYVVYKETYYRK